MPPWPSRSWPCGGWWIGWRATGSGSSRRSMAGEPPGLIRARRLARRLAGCGPGCVWVLGLRPALFGRPGPCSVVRWPAPASALPGGELTCGACSRCWPMAPKSLPDQVTVEAEPVLVAAACRLDPPRLRRVLGHLQLVADPDGADRELERRHGRRGLWLAPTLDGMVAVDGLLEPEAGQSLLAALEPLARPADANDTRSGSQRNADALAELARRALGGGPAPPGWWGPAPADGDRGSGQPGRPPRSLWAVRSAGRGRWTRRRAGGWPVIAR